MAIDPRRYAPHTVYEQDGITISIDRGYGLGVVCIYVSKRGYTPGKTLILQDNKWEEMDDGTMYPKPSFQMTADIAWLLRRALAEGEPVAETDSALLHTTLKKESERVDKMLGIILKGMDSDGTGSSGRD